jgi:hypothetical protein
MHYVNITKDETMTARERDVTTQIFGHSAVTSRHKKRMYRLLLLLLSRISGNYSVHGKIFGQECI